MRTKDLLQKYKRQRPTYKIRQSKDGKTIEIHKGTKTAQKETGVHRSTILLACNSGKEARGYNWEFYYESEPTNENEKGCKTIREALDKAIEEQHVIFNKSVLVSYSQVGRYIRKNREYEGAQINHIMREFMETTGLDKFCNNGKQPTYSVSRERDTLPVYEMPVIGRVVAGRKTSV